MKKVDVQRYLDHTRRVEGWFFPIDALLFAMLDEIQKEEGIAGDLFEIGVHHGKTAIFLARMARSGERLGVCDLFEHQELNRDRSGEGSRELFLRNMKELGEIEPPAVRVFAGPSAELTVDQTTRDCRFFHIDGGHRPDDVAGDLRTAERALTADGIVAVDDVFNPSWPGVSEGFYRFLGANPHSFVPILIGGNKVMLTRPEAADRYERHWRPPDRWQSFIDPLPFALQWKEWLGRPALTAARQTWVDLDPEGAARGHGAAMG